MYGKSACPVLWGTGARPKVWLRYCGTAGKPGGKRRKQTSACSHGSPRSTRLMLLLCLCCEIWFFSFYSVLVFSYNSLRIWVFFLILIQKHLFIIRVIHKEREIYDSFLLIPLYSSWSFGLFGSCDSSFSKEGQDERVSLLQDPVHPSPKSRRTLNNLLKTCVQKSPEIAQ